MMKTRVGPVALWLLLFASMAFGAQTHYCRYVIDGDTIVVDGVGKVRLIGVDTPELARDGHYAEPGGEEARVWLDELIGGKQLRLVYGEERYDKYGRVLAYVFTGEGVMVNRALIEEGLAEPIWFWPYRYKDQFIKLYRGVNRNKAGRKKAGRAPKENDPPRKTGN